MTIIDDLIEEFEDLYWVSQVSVEPESSGKGVVLHISVSEGYEGDEELFGDVIERVPPEFEPSEEMIDIYYDAFEVHL